MPSQPPPKAESGHNAAVPQLPTFKQPPVKVTRAVYSGGTYDASKAGYPSTGSTRRELSAANYKEFEWLMAQVLNRTLYNDEVSLGEFIALELAGNEGEVKRIDALGRRDRGQPSGSGSHSSFDLYDGDKHVYSFRDDDSAYTGGWISRLKNLTADPTSPLFEDESPLRKLYQYMSLLKKGRSYAVSMGHELKGRSGAILYEFLGSEKYMSQMESFEPWLRVLEMMAGGSKGLHDAARTFTEKLVVFNRSVRALRRYSAANKPEADDSQAKSLLANLVASKTDFETTIANLKREVDAYYKSTLDDCQTRHASAGFAQKLCRLLQDSQAVIIAHETGDAALEALLGPYRTHVAELEAIAVSEAEKKIAELGPRILREFESRNTSQYYNMQFHYLMKAYVTLASGREAEAP